MPTNFVIAQVMMLLAFHEVKAQKNRVLSFPLVCLILYAVLVFVPVAGWYFYNFTAWSEVYINPESQIAEWVGPGFFLQYVTGMFFGGLLAQTLIQLGRTWLVFVTLTLGLAWLASTWAFTFDQYLHLGSFAEYHGGIAKPILEDTSFQMKLNIGGAIMALPLIGLGYWFVKRSKRISRKWFR